MSSDRIALNGMVLSSMPMGEYDRRLVILTRERGKISAFAKGARRPNSSLLAGSRPFSFGRFWVYEGRNSYTVRSMEISNYFEGLAQDLEGACYGSYFMEFADYYGREGVDETDMLNLLYVSLRALGREALPKPLVRYIFELRAMAINGEYSETPFVKTGESAAYAWDFVLRSPFSKLYTFTLTPETLCEFARAVEGLKDYYIDREFKSLAILQAMTGVENLYEHREK